MYNEEKIIKRTVTDVKIFMEKNFSSGDLDYEVLFVNDGSRDNTLEIAQSMSDNKVRVLTYKTNKGKGYAVRTGMLAASGDIIFFTDCDLAYGLDVICAAYRLFEENNTADVLIGSRTLHKEGYKSYTFMRKITSKIYMMILRVYGGIKLSDSQSGFKGFRQNGCRKIFSVCETNGWCFDIEVLLTAQNYNMKILELPVKIINHSASKITIIKDSISMLREIRYIKRSVRKKFADKTGKN